MFICKKRGIPDTPRGVAVSQPRPLSFSHLASLASTPSPALHAPWKVATFSTGSYYTPSLSFPSAHWRRNPAFTHCHTSLSLCYSRENGNPAPPLFPYLSSLTSNLAPPRMPFHGCRFFCYTIANENTA